MLDVLGGLFVCLFLTFIDVSFSLRRKLLVARFCSLSFNTSEVQGSILQPIIRTFCLKGEKPIRVCGSANCCQKYFEGLPILLKSLKELIYHYQEKVIIIVIVLTYVRIWNEKAVLSWNNGQRNLVFLLFRREAHKFHHMQKNKQTQRHEPKGP